MNKYFILIILFAFLFSVKGTGQDLSSHIWENRLLLISAPDENRSEYQDQLAILRENTEGLEERKLVVYSLLPDKYKKGLRSENWLSSTVLSDLFRDRNNDFEVILIGLDGGVKLQQREVLSTEKLFSVIDAMPMRIRELQRKQ